MGTLIGLVPTAAQISAGELVPLHYSGPDTAPVLADTASGADEAGYHFRQDVPAVNWTVTHALGRYPSVTVQCDASAEGIAQVDGLVEHLNPNQLVLRFGEPVVGIAWLR